MNPDVRTLAKLVPPPDKPKCSVGDWGKIERVIGFALPPDYKDFIGTYGTGSLQSFMHIWNYLDVKSPNDILEAIQQINSIYEGDKNAGYPIQFKPFPEPGCILPFCSTDDGNYLNWLTVGKPNKWHVVAYDFGTGQLIPAESVNMVKCLTMLIEQNNPFGDAFCNVESFVPPITYE
jgi:hypothetical protein